MIVNPWQCGGLGPMGTVGPWWKKKLLKVLYLAEHPPVGQGFLILEVSRSHTHRRTTVGRTPLDEWSARCRDLYLTTHNTHNRQTSMPPAGFELTISAGERPQTYALDRAVTETGTEGLLSKNIEIKIHRPIILPVVLYGCETWSLILRKERRPRVFENRVLRRIFGRRR